DKTLKVEVKDARALEHQGFRRKKLASEKQKLTYLENEQCRVDDNPDGQYNLEFWPQNCISRVEDQIAKLNSRFTKERNPSTKPEDQFQGTIVRNVDIGVENNGSDNIILVSKMVHDEEEDKESSDLPESDGKVFRNIKWAKNGKVVTFEVSNVKECMNIVEANYIEIVNLLFDPRGRERDLNNIFRP
ncbi:25657_t:CDS:2, partial [Gigaspora rosea]